MKYENELAFAKSLAKEAGKMMRDAFDLSASKSWKDDHSPITVTDIAINELAIKKVKQAFPGDGVHGEEISHEPQRKRIWVCDPIDGTYPFTLGAPLSTFCLGMVENGEPVLGVVYDPYIKRLFWAVRGQGAFVNKSPIHVSKARKLKDHYVILSSRVMGSGMNTGVVFDKIEAAGGKAFNFRSFAYSCCLVAAGTASAATIGTPKPWDVAAVKVILEEAGGKITDVFGKLQPYDSPAGMVATNGLVHDELLELLK